MSLGTEFEEEDDLGEDAEFEMAITLETDENGMIGRECPECSKYFKVKPGTGLDTSNCICPYCGFIAAYRDFTTDDQLEYVRSVGLKEVIERFVEPEIEKLNQTFRQLPKATQGGIFEIKVETPNPRRDTPIHYYEEKEVETNVTCDNCGLEFSIFGVFAGCPDCGKLNALTIFKKSIEVARKRLAFFRSTEDPDLQEAILRDALSDSVSSFDAFGKALRERARGIFPSRPRNLFQNLDALSNALSQSTGKSLSHMIGEETYSFLYVMFQVRHIYSHNMGIVDDNFVRKIPDLSHMHGRKYVLKQDEVDGFLDSILGAGEEIAGIEKEQGAHSNEE